MIMCFRYIIAFGAILRILQASFESLFGSLGSFVYLCSPIAT